MTPEQLTTSLIDACPTPIRSIVLYGSAAAGDYVGSKSDYNILVITERLGLKELRALSQPTAAWVKAGNPPPLLFTLERLRKSADTFPIELLDIRESHRILHGDDFVSALDIRTDNLRHQLEHELKGALIRLREGFLMTGDKPSAVIELLVRSLSTFLVLFRAALRLYADTVPARKLEALALLTERVHFDPAPFQTVEEIKEGKLGRRAVDAHELFGDYLTSVEAVVDAIDRHRPFDQEGETDG